MPMMQNGQFTPAQVLGGGGGTQGQPNLQAQGQNPAAAVNAQQGAGPGMGGAATADAAAAQLPGAQQAAGMPPTDPAAGGAAAPGAPPAPGAAPPAAPAAPPAPAPGFVPNSQGTQLYTKGQGPINEKVEPMGMEGVVSPDASQMGGMAAMAQPPGDPVGAGAPPMPGAMELQASAKDEPRSLIGDVIDRFAVSKMGTVAPILARTGEDGRGGGGEGTGSAKTAHQGGVSPGLPVRRQPVEKTAIIGLSGAAGAGLGAINAPKGKKYEGTGRGLLLGLGTGAGAAGGALGGNALGGLATGGMDEGTAKMLLQALATVGGAGAGAYGGYKLTDSVAPETSYDKDEKEAYVDSTRLMPPIEVEPDEVWTKEANPLLKLLSMARGLRPAVAGRRAQMALRPRIKARVQNADRNTFGNDISGGLAPHPYKTMADPVGTYKHRTSIFGRGKSVGEVGQSAAKAQLGKNIAGGAAGAAGAGLLGNLLGKKSEVIGSHGVPMVSTDGDMQRSEAGKGDMSGLKMAPWTQNGVDAWKDIETHSGGTGPKGNSIFGGVVPGEVPGDSRNKVGSELAELEQWNETATEYDDVKAQRLAELQKADIGDKEHVKLSGHGLLNIEVKTSDFGGPDAPDQLKMPGVMLKPSGKQQQGNSSFPDDSIDMNGKMAAMEGGQSTMEPVRPSGAAIGPAQRNLPMPVTQPSLGAPSLQISPGSMTTAVPSQPNTGFGGSTVSASDLTPFAESFLDRCIEKGFDEFQIVKAAEFGSSLSAKVAADLAPLLEKEAIKKKLVEWGAKALPWLNKAKPLVQAAPKLGPVSSAASKGSLLQKGLIGTGQVMRSPVGRTGTGYVAGQGGARGMNTYTGAVEGDANYIDPHRAGLVGGGGVAAYKLLNTPLGKQAPKWLGQSGNAANPLRMSGAAPRTLMNTGGMRALGEAVPRLRGATNLARQARHPLGRAMYGAGAGGGVDLAEGLTGRGWDFDKTRLGAGLGFGAGAMRSPLVRKGLLGRFGNTPFVGATMRNMGAASRPMWGGAGKIPGVNKLLPGTGRKMMGATGRDKVLRGIQATGGAATAADLAGAVGTPIVGPMIEGQAAQMAQQRGTEIAGQIEQSTGINVENFVDFQTGQVDGAAAHKEIGGVVSKQMADALGIPTVDGQGNPLTDEQRTEMIPPEMAAQYAAQNPDFHKIATKLGTLDANGRPDVALTLQKGREMMDQAENSGFGGIMGGIRKWWEGLSPTAQIVTIGGLVAILGGMMGGGGGMAALGAAAAGMGATGMLDSFMGGMGDKETPDPKTTDETRREQFNRHYKEQNPGAPGDPAIGLPNDGKDPALPEGGLDADPTGEAQVGQQESMAALAQDVAQLVPGSNPAEVQQLMQLAVQSGVSLEKLLSQKPEHLAEMLKRLKAKQAQ